MKLALPKPSGTYDPGNEAQARTAIEQADQLNIKRTDLAIVRSPPSGRAGIAFTSLQLLDTGTNTIRTLTVHSGTIVIT